MPERGDPIRLAELGRFYEGELALTSLKRLGESIVPSSEKVTYEIRFDRDDRGRGRIQGWLQANVPLTCQRCLGTYRLPLNRVWQLILIEEASEEALLDEGEDACLVDDTGMELARLVEDELILALPLVPAHPDNAGCRLPDNPAADEENRSEPGVENPFAALGNLRREN